jgi:hypothetical protein
MSQKSFDLSAVIDTDRYPLLDKADPRRAALMDRLRSELETQQFCVLPNFIRAERLPGMVKEVRQLQDVAYRNRSHRNCYLYRTPDPTLPEDHPKNLFFDASYRMLAYDLFPEDATIKGIYNAQPMIDFVAELVGAPALYPNEDKFQPVNVLCYGNGDQSTWHFDSFNAFTLTLMLQAAEAGGEFEIAPNTRTQTDPKYDEVKKVLRGDRSRIVTVPREPGAFVIFRGCNSVHRVTPVKGDKDRMMAVFVYEESRGIKGDPAVNATIYGPRVAALQGN